MKFLVYGAGAVGGYFGARLSQAGQSVIFLARGANLQAIRESGLKVESPKGDYTVWPANVTDNVASVTGVDAVILGVKAWQVCEVAKSLSPLLQPTTQILTLQNGIEAPVQLADLIGKEHVLGCVCKIICSLVAPGQIRHLGMEPALIMGELGKTSDSKSGEPIAEALRGAGITVELTNDIEAALWQKLLFIAPMSGVGAVSRSTIGEVRRIPETRGMLQQAMEEILAVAQAKGIFLNQGVVNKTMAFVDTLPPQGTASMQRDIMEGRPSELEAISGIVVRMANSAEIDVPLSRFIYSALLPQETRVRAMPSPA